MKKFITALAATFATVVIGSAASAATPATFNVYHEEVMPALVENVANYNWDAMPTSERITPVTVARLQLGSIACIRACSYFCSCRL